MLENDAEQNTFGGKVKMISVDDRAFVLDQLANKAPATPRAMEVLAGIAKSKLISQDEVQVIIERTMRDVTLYGTVNSKAAMLEGVAPKFLCDASNELREAIFEEATAIIRRDQFEEVNKLVPALEKHLQSIPKNLHVEFVFSLFDQSRSMARQGAPAAQRMLRDLPAAIAKNAVDKLDAKKLCDLAHQQAVRDFVKSFKEYASDEQGEVFDDFLALSPWHFIEKYSPEDN